MHPHDQTSMAVPYRSSPNKSSGGLWNKKELTFKTQTMIGHSFTSTIDVKPTIKKVADVFNLTLTYTTGWWLCWCKVLTCPQLGTGAPNQNRQVSPTTQNGMSALCYIQLATCFFHYSGWVVPVPCCWWGYLSTWCLCAGNSFYGSMRDHPATAAWSKRSSSRWTPPNQNPADRASRGLKIENKEMNTLEVNISLQVSFMFFPWSFTQKHEAMASFAVPGKIKKKLNWQTFYLHLLKLCKNTASCLFFPWKRQKTPISFLIATQKEMYGSKKAQR